MEYLIGAILAVSVSIFAAVVGLDRDRAFYPTVLTVVASYYGLFAVLGGSTEALVAESAVMVVFVAATVLGFRRNLWIVAAGLFAHGVFDFFHGGFIPNPGLPAWWPAFCMTYDVVAAACLGGLLRASRIRATAT